MQIAVDHRQTSYLVDEVFRKLPAKQRKCVQTGIAAVTDTELVTAVRPFMFGGRVVHELYFDPAKLLFFTRQEKIGAVVSAFIIASLAQNNQVPLSDQALRTHARLITRCAQRLNYGYEVSAFLGRFRCLEDRWRRDAFPDLTDDTDSQCSGLSENSVLQSAH